MQDLCRPLAYAGLAVHEIPRVLTREPSALAEFPKRGNAMILKYLT